MVALGFAKAEPATLGGPPYALADLLKLYLYGYLHQVRSLRWLERECKRNIEVMWLLKRWASDFKTIASFRKQNTAALTGICAAFVEFALQQNLIDADA
jgi:transposase